jgi:hypothetical protein
MPTRYDLLAAVLIAPVPIGLVMAEWTDNLWWLLLCGFIFLFPF